METSTGQGLTEEGNWKPPHHGAGKTPPFTVQKKTQPKNPNLTIGQEDLNGLLQTTLPYLSLPISPVSSCWPCCPAHSQGTWQQGSKKGTLAPARLFGGKLGEATQNSECTRKSTFASRESSASGWLLGRIPHCSQGFSWLLYASISDTALCRCRVLRAGSLLLWWLGFDERFRCWRAEPGRNRNFNHEAAAGGRKTWRSSSLAGRGPWVGTGAASPGMDPTWQLQNQDAAGQCWGLPRDNAGPAVATACNEELQISEVNTLQGDKRTNCTKRWD